MPRVADIYSRPAGIDAVPNATIESVDYNANVADVEADLNLPRPIVAGGTGANDALNARKNLQVERSMQQVTNYDSHIWEPGSFFSLTTATSPPIVGHSFHGEVYGTDQDNLVLNARDYSDTMVPGRVYVREKKLGTWTGGWKLEGSSTYVELVGDTMTGNLTIGTVGGTPVTPHPSSMVCYVTSAINHGFNAYFDTGGQWRANTAAPSFVIAVQTDGRLNFYSAPTVAANAVATISQVAYLTASGQWFAQSYNSSLITGFGMYSSGSDAIFQMAASKYMRHIASDNCIYFANGNNSFRIQPDANLLMLSGLPYKPGGGPWLDSTSDERVKNVEGQYPHGLDQIVQLRPVYYTFKGNDTSEPPSKDAVPYPESPHHKVAQEQKRFAGLIAQEVEAIFPEMVDRRAGYIDGEPVTDLRSMDTAPLIYALINAVKTLAARVTELEAKP
jgi:hypothetical protein